MAMPVGVGRIAGTTLALAGLVVMAAGCAFDSPIRVQFGGASPATVIESLEPEQVPHRVRGATTRAAQVVRIDCSTTIVYDVREASGSAVLVQTYAVHLRTRPLRRGTRYELDCAGPLIVEIPADAAGVRATSTSASGAQLALAVQAPLASVPIALGKRLRAEPRMQLAVVRWPRTLPRGHYRMELAFDLPEARPIREKALMTASISCGRSRYLRPILPPVTSMARVRAFTLQPSENPIMLPAPRIVGGIGSYAETTRTLSCR